MISLSRSSDCCHQVSSDLISPALWSSLTLLIAVGNGTLAFWERNRRSVWISAGLAITKVNGKDVVDVLCKGDIRALFSQGTTQFASPVVGFIDHRAELTLGHGRSRSSTTLPSLPAVSPCQCFYNLHTTI